MAAVVLLGPRSVAVGPVAVAPVPVPVPPAPVAPGPSGVGRWGRGTGPVAGPGSGPGFGSCPVSWPRGRGWRRGRGRARRRVCRAATVGERTRTGIGCLCDTPMIAPLPPQGYPGHP